MTIDKALLRAQHNQGISLYALMTVVSSLFSRFDYLFQTCFGINVYASPDNRTIKPYKIPVLKINKELYHFINFTLDVQHTGVNYIL